MLIEIDLSEAKRHNLTVNQLILIKLLLEEEKVKSYQSVIPIIVDDIQTLIKANILTEDSVLTEDFDKLKISESFLAKHRPRSFFDEFYALYPTSIIRPDGVKDYLRGDIHRCRTYYNKLVGKSLTKHEHIVDALKFELTTRRANNKMGFMKRMYKWLTSEEWTLYEEFLNDTKVQEHIGALYGADVE